MQCQSYLPVYRSHYDLNADANGGARPMYNGNGTFRNGHYNDYVSPSPVPQEPFTYGKEIVRQTILMQEVTFKDQIQELHRLYRRQKELMGEFRSKELHMNHSHLEAQCSNSISENFSSRSGQNAQHGLPLFNPHCWPSTTRIDDFQAPLNSINERILPPSPIVSQFGGTSNNLHYPESKGKKVGGKFLDLELPAEVYIDSEEEDSFDAQNYGAPVSTTNLADLNELPTLHVENHEWKREPGASNSCPDISERNLDLFGLGNARSDGASDILKFCTTRFDEAISVYPGSSQRKPLNNMEKNSSVIQALPCLTNQPSSSKGAKTCSRIKRLIDDKFDGGSRLMSFNSSCSESKLKESMVSMSSMNSDCLKHVKGFNCIDLNSTVLANAEFRPSTDKEGKNVMFSESGLKHISLSPRGNVISPKQIFVSSVHSVDSETTKMSKKRRLIDINLPCDLSTEEEPLIEDDLVEHDYKNSGQKILNLCVDDDGLPTRSSSLDRIALQIDLEAPPSPEVEERPPPRGDSEENQPEHGGDPLEELVNIAAQAIVSMSSFESQPCSVRWDPQKSEAVASDTLEWFAGLVPSLSDDLENDFEALTLNLTEMKAEEHWCQNSLQKVESVTCSMVLPGQMRKGRGRRSKRKDFQREVLPSLASLSRYEVTEDIQMIEGLMEAVGTPWHLSRTKRACRMGRKPRAAKQQTFTFDDPDLKIGALVSWGKGNRRPRGRRSPASPSTVLSKWLEHMI